MTDEKFEKACDLRRWKKTLIEMKEVLAGSQLTRLYLRGVVDKTTSEEHKEYELSLCTVNERDFSELQSDLLSLINDKIAKIEEEYINL